jgi:predicted nucleic acid-binding protein
MALVSPLFFDTTVLLAGLIELGPASVHAQRVMTAVAGGRIRGPQTAWHCCLEFYAVATRLPEEFRLAPDDARRLVEEEVLARFQVHQLAASGRAAFMAWSAQERVAGGRIYDAHIAEVARQAGARAVVTDNRRHFSALARYGVRLMSSEDLAGEARM